MSQGADGLSVETLRTSREAWWDDAFTDFLAGPLPARPGLLVDVGCGLAAAALTLLPRFPELRYLGIDVDEERLELARTAIEAAGLDGRADLEVASAAALPRDDASVDVVLTVMTLQHLADVPSALAEARRVLCPGGIIVTVEPDNLGQRFYFDGMLDGVDDAVRQLCAAFREHRKPADLAVGPRVPRLLDQAGFVAEDACAYPIHDFKPQLAGSFFDRIRGMIEAVRGGAGLPADDPLVLAGLRSIETAEARIGRDSRGYGCHLVPVFRSTAAKQD